MILPPAATAASGADPSNPSLDQYVESVPTSHGGAPPGPGSTRGHLSTSIRHQIARRGGADASQLEALATSSAYGAPATAAGSTAGRGGAAAVGDPSSRPPTPSPPTRAADRPSGLDAIASSATSGDGDSIGLLLGGLVLITALVAGTALARRRFGAA